MADKTLTLKVTLPADIVNKLRAGDTFRVVRRTVTATKTENVYRVVLECQRGVR